MKTIAVVGLDLAKSVFQIHAIDADGKVVVRRQLRRGEGTFVRLPAPETLHESRTASLQQKRLKADVHEHSINGKV
jgi:hypothetical protein